MPISSEDKNKVTKTSWLSMLSVWQKLGKVVCACVYEFISQHFGGWEAQDQGVSSFSVW
jgi:hypothetical protein